LKEKKKRVKRGREKNKREVEVNEGIKMRGIK